MKRVVFVCTENANRSQMAEAFARRRRPDLEIWSAGSAPGRTIGPGAVASMGRLGVDLADQHPKSLGDLPPGPFDIAVTMGCGDTCPGLKADRRYDWDLSDPRDLPAPEFDSVRDDIEKRVRRLLESLD